MSADLAAAKAAAVAFLGSETLPDSVKVDVQSVRGGIPSARGVRRLQGP